MVTLEVVENPVHTTVTLEVAMEEEMVVGLVHMMDTLEVVMVARILVAEVENPGPMMDTLGEEEMAVDPVTMTTRVAMVCLQITRIITETAEEAVENLDHMMVPWEEVNPALTLEEEVVENLVPIPAEEVANPGRMTVLEKEVAMEATPKDTKVMDRMMALVLERAVVNLALMTEATQRVTKEMEATPTDIKGMVVILMMVPGRAAEKVPVPTLEVVENPVLMMDTLEEEMVDPIATTAVMEEEMVEEIMSMTTMVEILHWLLT